MICVPFNAKLIQIKNKIKQNKIKKIIKNSKSGALLISAFPFPEQQYREIFLP